MKNHSAIYYEFEDFRFDPESGVLLRNSEVVDVTPKALEILRVLIENEGELTSRDELLEKVWSDSFVEEANLSHHISKLRKALGEDEGHKFIETLPRRGYRFVGKVNRSDQSQPIVAPPYAKSPKGKILITLALASVAIAAVIVGWVFMKRSPIIDVPVQSIADIRSIAVMPFINESGDENVEYLADGMTETLISSLSRIASLRIKPRSAVFAYKGKEMDSRRVGAELSVQAILTGRVIKHGDSLTLFLSLIDTQSEYQIWGKQYERKMSDLATLQSEIGRDVAQSLEARLTGTDDSRLAANYSQNAEAYRLYLLGRFYWNKFTADGLHKAIDSFEKAIAIDKNYALAYAGLADTYTVLGVNGHMPVRDARPKAKMAAEMGVALDGNLSNTRVALGAYLYFFEWDLIRAENELKRAIDLDPTNAGPHELMAYVMRVQRRMDEALVSSKKASDLDPTSMVVVLDLATFYRYAGNLSEGLKVTNRLIEMDPNFPDAHFENGFALSQSGLHDKAIDEMKLALKLSDDSTHTKSGLGQVYARAGRRAEAYEVIDELISASEKRYVSPLDVALIYSTLNDRDKAFAWLERSFNERTCWLIEMNVEPALDPIRSDPRFHDLAIRVGLDK